MDAVVTVNGRKKIVESLFRYIPEEFLKKRNHVFTNCNLTNLIYYLSVFFRGIVDSILSGIHEVVVVYQEK